MHGVAHGGPSDAAEFLQQQLSDCAIAWNGGDPGGAEYRRADHSHRRARARGGRSYSMAGRSTRAMGREFAGGGDDQFQRQNEFPRVGSEDEADREVHQDGSGYDNLPIYGGRS